MTNLHAVLSKQILTIDFQMYVVVAVRLRPMHIGEKGKYIEEKLFFQITLHIKVM